MMMSDMNMKPTASTDDGSSDLLLPEEVWENIALNYLTVKDILSLLCVNCRIYKELNYSITFWNKLSLRDGISCYEKQNLNLNVNVNVKENDNNWRKAKSSYLFRCYKNDPSKNGGGGVKWYPVRTYGRNTNIDDREGHVACVLERNSRRKQEGEEEGRQQQQQEAEAVVAQQQEQDRTVVITGGFSNDDSVYLIHAGTGNVDVDNANANANNADDEAAATATAIDRDQQILGLGGGRTRWRMEQLQPVHRSTFVYGSTLTSLPTIYHSQHQQQSQQQKEGDEDVDDDDKEDDDNEEDKSGKKNMETTTKTDTDDDNNIESSRPPIVIAEMRALRFGGFLAGGYSNETQQVSMLTIKEVIVEEEEEEDEDPSPTRRRTGFPGRFFQRRRLEQEQQRQRQQQRSSSTWIADWIDIPTTPPPGVVVDGDSNLSRAYHSATLILDRYLLIIGGMKSTTSIGSEYILDTHTWEWIDDISSCSTPPSGRHGHSVILDDKRNRLLLFGGGSGSDLLRSGIDNSEVWELNMDTNWRTNLKASLPWTWNKLHDDCNNMNSVGSSSGGGGGGGGGDNDDSEDESTTTTTTNSNNSDNNSKLSPAETLCLGRCHNCIKISRDTVLLLFGSGRPSTNGMIAYDLTTDTFFRQKQHQKDLQQSNNAAAAFAAAVPRRLAGIGDNAGVHVKGILPKPRFTGIAAFLEEDGYIITHGGYCSQDHDTIGTMDVLDLAPSFPNRRRNKFDGLAIDDQRVTYGEVTNVQAQQSRRNPEAALQQMLETLMNTPREDHQTVAREMLVQMNNGEYPSNGHSLLLMSMIANGNVPLFRSNDEEEDDSSGDYDGGENDDDEYVEEESTMDDDSDNNDD